MSRAKRPRLDDMVGPRMRGGKFYSGNAARRGKWAQMKFSKVQPWETFGAMRVARGTAENLERFGPSFKEATGAQRFNRKSLGYTGRGKYGMKTFKSIYKTVSKPSFIKGVKRGVAAGADVLAGLTPVVPELAPLAGAAEGLSSYIGRGMYMPKKHGVNDLIAGGGSSVPTVRNVDDETGSLIVTHRERVSDVIAPADDKFHIKTFTVQPGNESVFPWLSQLASCYEEYEVIQCVFEYKGHDIVGLQSTMDLQGQVIAATKYNVKSPSFTDRHEMQAYPHSAACSMNGTLQSGIEAHPSKIASGDTHRYIRTGGLKAGEEVTDFDHARFELALNNTPTDLQSKEVGQLFVYYTVKLTKPRLYAGRGKAISTYEQASKSTLRASPFGTIDNANQPYYVASRNSLDMKFVPGSNLNKWQFPANASGKYRCVFIIEGDNMDTGVAGVDMFATFAGEVSLSKSVIHTYDQEDPARPEQGVYAFGRMSNQADANTHTLLTVDVIVRPQIGDTANEIRINSNFNDDTISKSYVSITEINDLDAGAALPEFVHFTTGAVTTEFA